MKLPKFPGLVKEPRYELIIGSTADGSFQDYVSKALEVGATLVGGPLIDTENRFYDEHPIYPGGEQWVQAAVFPTEKSVSAFLDYTNALDDYRLAEAERAAAQEAAAEAKREAREAKRVARDLAKRAAENRKLAAAEAAELKEKWNLGAFLL